MINFTCSGSVRRNCGHSHRTLNGAVQCLVKDRRACAAMGGGSYSDRAIVKCVDGKPVRLREDEQDSAADLAYDLWQGASR